MAFTDLTEDQLTTQLDHARDVTAAAGEWLHEATVTLEAARRSLREANEVVEDLDDDTPELAIAYIASCAADANVQAANMAHERAVSEIKDGEARVFELTEALDIKRGGAGYEL